MNFTSLVSAYQFDGKLAAFFRENTKDLCAQMTAFFSENITAPGEFQVATAIVEDLLTCSDLSAAEKNDYEKMLAENCFFEDISKYLFVNDIQIASSLIATMGRMQISKNSKFLQKAFTVYFDRNPLLAYRCLSELSWLKSKSWYFFLLKTLLSASPINKMTIGLLYDSRPNKDAVYTFFLRKYRELQTITNPDLYFSSFECYVNKTMQTENACNYDRERFLQLISSFDYEYANNREALFKNIWKRSGAEPEKGF